MLYYLYTHYVHLFGALNIFKYITVRAFVSFFIALSIYFLFGKKLIAMLSKKQFWQTVRDDGPVQHLDKRGTPTMGGVLILAAIIISTLLCARLDNFFVLGSLFVLIGFGAIGFVDDYRKVILKDAKGLASRYKFLFQLLFGLIASLFLFDVMQLGTELSVPFFKGLRPDLGMWYIPFATVVIVGASNAVNLTDGLDGLVSFPSIVSYAAYAVLTYIAGHALIASYLQGSFVPGCGELAVVCGSVVGAVLAFLWYNAHPASIFMGDVGSLPLGALLGYVALVAKQEMLLLIIGGIFVLETVSVITQVVSFKLTGKRIFRMAPIHHHFELKGWKESKVIVRFWIISILLALASLATLKLR